MAKLPGVGEQIQYELFDTLVRGVNNSAIAVSTSLFRALNTGNPELTNMQEGGRLSNEELLLILSIRFYVQFATAQLYREVEDGIMWKLRVGNKDMIGPVPLFLAPAGGGLFGMDLGAPGAHVISNGVPGWNNILKLAKPILVDKNDHFEVNCTWYAFPQLSAVGGVAAINPLTDVNADAQLRVIKCFIGGIGERPVQ